jgi:hypothetical protein
VKFVEVVGGDREELHSLEQRMRVVSRLGQHTGVEGQPAELAVEVQRRVGEVRLVGLGSLDGIERARCRTCMLSRLTPAEADSSK